MRAERFPKIVTNSANDSRSVINHRQFLQHLSDPTSYRTKMSGLIVFFSFFFCSILLLLTLFLGTNSNY